MGSQVRGQGGSRPRPLLTIPLCFIVSQKITIAKAYKDLSKAETANEKAKTFNVIFDYVCASSKDPLTYR